MSHEATNWAIKQRGLKPTTKIVLWHLCDRFNPDYGCFPSPMTPPSMTAPRSPPRSPNLLPSASSPATASDALSPFIPRSTL